MSITSGSRVLAVLVVAVGATLYGAPAGASTLTQNLSWTIDRSGTSTRYRIAAYGDSIYAGYYGSFSSVIKRAAPVVAGEYLARSWNTDILVVRRTKSGAVASDIYNNKIVAERSHMQTSDTRVVTVEMCGNDYLQARSSFNGQSGTCNYSGASTALSNCTTYMGAAMSYINANAYPGTKVKIIANLYYPGYNADNVLSSCTDSLTGQRVNKQSLFLGYIARSNWRACNLAAQYGWRCADSFAEYMGADYDANGDGQVDSNALRWIAGEGEDAYVTRITSTLRSTIRDSNTHFVSAGASYDYLQSDDTHPTYVGSTIWLGFIGGSGSGSGSAQYADSDIVDGKNPAWNRNGHDRMGWALSQFLPATP